MTIRAGGTFGIETYVLGRRSGVRCGSGAGAAASGAVATRTGYTLAARRAAERRAVLDPALFTRGREATRSGDVPAMIEADLAFHTTILSACGNQYVRQMQEALSAMLRAGHPLDMARELVNAASIDAAGRWAGEEEDY